MYPSIYIPYIPNAQTALNSVFIMVFHKPTVSGQYSYGQKY